MRRGVAFGLVALGFLVLFAPDATAQSTSPPPTSAPTAPATTAPGATEPPATTRVLPRQSAGGGISAGGEGFPWIPVGIGILIAGLVGSRLRRASRR